MATRGKKYLESVKMVDPKLIYSLENGLDLLKKMPTRKFDSSIEIHVKLGIDPKKGEELVKGSVTLPHGTGKEKKVAVFAEGEKATEAKGAGADIIGGKELVDEIKKTGKFEGADVVVATPDMMKLMAPVAKVLGPKGLMPSTKTETVTTNVANAVKELKKGKINFKNDEGGNLHQMIGKLSWEKEKLLSNARALLEAVRKAKPPKSKGLFFQTITLTSTMGPGIKVSL